MAEGLLRRELRRLGLTRKIWVDSAGTYAAQTGRPPDPRARRVCLQAGVDIRRCRARQVREQDFRRFDYIFAMEQKNYRWLVEACPESFTGKISLLGSLIGDGEQVDIPDPYFSSTRAFDVVLGLLEQAVSKVVLQIVETNTE
jgi:protein-tyrosine phosphatase